MKLIYFDIDTLRVDHLSCYGYNRQTPNIDALAQNGVRFTSAYASNTPCMPARAAIFTGSFGILNGVETHGEASLNVLTSPCNALTRVLANKGVPSATVSSFGRHPAPWFYNGFSYVLDPSSKCNANFFQRFDGAEVNSMATEFLDGFKGNDLFLHLHYWDPHGPLNPPKEWIDTSYTPNTFKVSDEELEQLLHSNIYRGGVHTAVKSREDLEELLRLYDAEIKYTDFLIGQMCDYLKRANMFEDMMIIVSSDHGEQYGEWQMVLEHGTVHNSCIHIPLILKFPQNIMAGEICASPVYALDIAPTIASYFNADIPNEWNGISLQNTVLSEELQREYLVCEHGLYTCQRAIIYNEFKMVHTFSKGLWNFAEYALYDLSQDEKEKNDISAANFYIFEKLCNFEKQWLSQLLCDENDLLARLGAENAQHGLKEANRITVALSQNANKTTQKHEVK